MPLFNRRPKIVRAVERIARRELGPSIETRFDEDADSIFIDGHELRLANVRRNWDTLEEPERSAWLDQLVTEILRPAPVPAELDDTAPLRNGLRSSSYIEAIRLLSQRDGHSPVLPVRRSVVPGLVEVLMWDSPTTISIVNEEAADQWDRDPADLFAIARSNVADLPRIGFAALDNRVFRLMNGDDYGSSRLLVDQALAELPTTDDIVAIVPTRNTLLVANADDADAVRIACELAVEETEDVAVYYAPLLRTGSSWSHLQLEGTHPAYAAWRRLTRMEQAQAANDVQQLLQQVVGDDLFVGSVMLREDEHTGIVESVAVWTEGVPTLLPEADVVVFPRTDQSAPIEEAPWSAVVEAAAELLEPTGFTPERWRVARFPTDDHFAMMLG